MTVLLRLFEGTEELRPRFSLNSSAAVFISWAFETCCDATARMEGAAGATEGEVTGGAAFATALAVATCCFVSS